MNLPKQTTMMMMTEKKNDPELMRKFFVSYPIAINLAVCPSVSINPKNFSKTDEISNTSIFIASVIIPRKIYA
jgi:hypothetical protein